MLGAYIQEKMDKNYLESSGQNSFTHLLHSPMKRLAFLPTKRSMSGVIFAKGLTLGFCSLSRSDFKPLVGPRLRPSSFYTNKQSTRSSVTLSYYIHIQPQSGKNKKYHSEVLVGLSFSAYNSKEVAHHFE